MLLCYFNIYKEVYKNRVSPTRRVLTPGVYASCVCSEKLPSFFQGIGVAGELVK